MSIYQKIAEIGSKFIGKPKLFKYGFNLSPMYRRSTAKIIAVSEDLLRIQIKLPISYKNRNYVSSVFGGSMFAAVDPIPMVQLMDLIGKEYIVWDKSAEIFFKRPAREDLYAELTYQKEELESIKQRIAEQDEIDIVKTTMLTNKDKTITYCKVKKTIYIADKSYFKKKRERSKTVTKD